MVLVLALLAVIALLLSRLAQRTDGEPLRAATAPAEARSERTSLRSPEERVNGESLDGVAAPARVAAPATSELSGRVVVPAGTPGDEVIVVRAARGHRRAARESFAVDHDGRFRVPLREREALWLELDAAHLWLAETLELDAPEPGAEVVLRPRLGARVLGRVVLAPAARAWGDAFVGVTPLVRASGGASEGAPVGADLRFELRALPADVPLSIELQAAPFARAGTAAELTLQPGEDREWLLEPHLGAAVHGRIAASASSAEPMRSLGEAVTVWRARGSTGARGQSLGRAALADDGSFVIGDLAPGDLVLRAAFDGHVPLELPIDALAEGELRALGTLALAPGLALRGRVLLPDGTVPWCAEVRLDDPTSPPRPDFRGACDARKVTLVEDAIYDLTDAEGRFELGGLGPGPYTLTVRHVAPDASVWQFVRTGVTAPLVPETVVLEPPARLAGRLFDAAGVPVGALDVRIQARFVGFDTPEPLRAGTLARNGSYTLDGLCAGPWEVTVAAPGCESASVRVVVAGAETALDLRLGPRL